MRSFIRRTPRPKQQDAKPFFSPVQRKKTLQREEAAGPKAEDEKMKQDMKQQNSKEEEKDAQKKEDPEKEDKNMQKMDKEKKIEGEEKVK